MVEAAFVTHFPIPPIYPYLPFTPDYLMCYVAVPGHGCNLLGMSDSAPIVKHMLLLWITVYFDWTSNHKFCYSSQIQLAYKFIPLSRYRVSHQFTDTITQT